MKKIFTLLVSLLIINSTSAESCFPEGITFYFQNQLNSFRTSYPDCTQIDGDLVISGYNIYDLTGLSNITYIGGSLKIESNEILTSLNGLNNLTYIGGDLYIQGNFVLPNLTGLDNVNFLGGEMVISNNVSLMSLTGLEGLTSINGKLWIDSNGSLPNLTGLNNVESVGGMVRIYTNPVLNSLEGLEALNYVGENLIIGGQDHLGGLGNPMLTSLLAMQSLTSIGGNLEIGYNSSLSALYGLDNISPGSIVGMSIYSNTMLSTCEIQSVCDYLSNPGGATDIYGNASGCNSIAEVGAACQALSAESNIPESSLTLYLDQVSGKLMIEISGAMDKCKYAVLDLSGRELIMGQITDQRTMIDMTSLPAGIYFIRLTNNKTVMMEKILKP